jgi:hypothetical protein
VDVGGGRIETVRFTDTPLNRATAAVLDVFEDRAKGLSANVRCQRLMEAARDPVFAEWIRRRPDGTWVHPALIAEIAEEPLDFSVSCFDLTGLASRVAARIAAGGYEDEQEPPEP